MTRIRTKNIYRSGDWSLYSEFSVPKLQTGTRTESFAQMCDDEVHPPPFTQEGNLHTRKIAGSPIRLDGFHDIPPFRWYSCSNMPLPWDLWDYTDNWTFPLEDWKVKALASVQASTPILDLPMSILELKDLPRTFKSLYRPDRQKHDPADLFLTNQFGISPIVSDVMKLLDLQKSIANRVRLHNRQYRTGRAEGSLPSSALYLPGWQPGSLNGFYGNATYWWTQEYEHRHHAWWTARITPLIKINKALERTLSNPLNLHTLSISAIWNLIPWSFLIDYFSNVGDYINLQTNIMPYNVDSVCLMCETQQEMVSTSYNLDTGITSKPGKVVITEKRRWCYQNPQPLLSISPFLTGRQIANVLALMVSGSRYSSG